MVRSVRHRFYSFGDQRRCADAHSVGQCHQHVKRWIDPSRFEAVDSPCADAGSRGKLSDADSLLLSYLPERLSEADQLCLLVHGFLS
jgi:hypothetical protein